MLKNKKQILFIEWVSTGRDLEIDLPLMYFFEKVLGWEVLYISIFNLPEILKTKPDLVIMSNTTGSIRNHEIAKLIHNSDILLFSHVSEGMYKENSLDGCLWGWNVEKKFNERLSIIWNMKSYLMSVNCYSYLANKLRVSGSIGHDKYQIYTDHVDLSKNYKKTIGYAAFDFEYTIKQEGLIVKRYGQNVYDLNVRDSTIVNNSLKVIVKNNPDILFIFKNHPGSGNNISIEFKDLSVFSNVLIVFNKTSIVDAIKSSDIWLNYRSSTNVEAWLLGKPSISLCSESCLLEYSPVCYGSVIESSPEKINSYISEFYQTGKIDRFEKLQKIREQIIKDSVGFDDGLNHVRFMSFLKPYIEKIEQGVLRKGKWKASLKERIIWYCKHKIFSISSRHFNIFYLKKWAHIYEKFNDDEVAEQKELKYPDFDNFYKNNTEKINFIYSEYVSNWKKDLDG